MTNDFNFDEENIDIDTFNSNQEDIEDNHNDEENGVDEDDTDLW